nr:hypothetical protein [Acidiphilium sp. 34-64-41]
MFRAIVEIDARHVGQHHEQVGRHLLRQQGAGRVLIDHGLDSVHSPVDAGGDGNSPATRTDHDDTRLDQPLDGADFDNGLRPWRGDHAAPSLTIGRDRPVMRRRDQARGRFVQHRADRLGRRGKSRIIPSDDNLGQQGCHLGANRQRVAQFALDRKADPAFAFRIQHIQRQRRLSRPGRRLQREQPNLRTVAVRQDQLMAGRDQCCERARRTPQRIQLIGGGQWLAALEQRVAAECDHDAHGTQPNVATRIALMVCIRFSA